MQIIIPLLQGITGLHGGGCQGTDSRLDSPLCSPPPTNLSEAQYDPGPPVWQEWPGACDPSLPDSLASVAHSQGLIWKQHRDGRVRRHWRPHSEDRSLLPRPSNRAPCSAAASPPLDHTWHGVLLVPAVHFYWHFTPPQGAKGLGRARLLLPRNPALPLLINVYSQHQTH